MGGEFDEPGIRAEAALHGFVQRRGFGLERDVADAEALPEERRQVCQHMLCATCVRDLNMRAHRWEAGGDGPHMHIMKCEHTFHLERGIGDALRFESARRPFEQDSSRLPQE